MSFLDGPPLKTCTQDFLKSLAKVSRVLPRIKKYPTNFVYSNTRWVKKTSYFYVIIFVQLFDWL